MLQEVLLAACLTIHFVFKSFDWRVLYELYLIIPLGTRLRNQNSHRCAEKSLAPQWPDIKHTELSTQSVLTSKVTDPKDTIYALVRIASNYQNGEIQADHSCSIPELCSDLLQNQSLPSWGRLPSTILECSEDLLDGILRIEKASTRKGDIASRPSRLAFQCRRNK